MDTPLLEIDQLSVSMAGRPLLQNLSFTVRAGERVGLVGESGSGKSLTAMAILQLQPPSFEQSGDIRLEGASLIGMPEPKRVRLRGAAASIVFQEPMTALNPLMNIGDQVAEAARSHLGLQRAAALAKAKLALERVGLTAQGISATRYPHELSGGQRQRVAIAMAVLLSPKLLIADEPTTALDARTQEEILDLLEKMVKEDGSALLLISHDLDVVARRTDRVVILQEGRVVDCGPSRSIFQEAAHPYTRRLAAASRYQSLRSPPPPARAGSTALLDVQNVVCDYGAARALDQVSLSVLPGESVGLIGESGAGKSTLLRAILGVQSITSGQIRLRGELLGSARGESLRQLRRRVQCVFQDPASSFDPRWRVERLVAEPLHLLDAPLAATERRERVIRLLERVGLSAGDADRFPHEFSGGQRQRIAIARALIVEPELVVLDEAVSALDAATRTQILELLADLSASLGIAYLFVSHDLNVMRCMTDRVLVLQRGRIVDSGPTSQLLGSLRETVSSH
jgi:peptide/nickel transport system ATP-binding protein